MAVVMRCEECRREVEVEPGGFVRMAEGWVELRVRKAERTAEHQFCGLLCAASWAKSFELARAEAKAATAEERRRFGVDLENAALGQGRQAEGPTDPRR